MLTTIGIFRRKMERLRAETTIRKNQNAFLFGYALAMTLAILMVSAVLIILLTRS